MKREELEHIIRAAAEITGEREFVIIGSQAVLGQFPDPPSALLVSMEADIHPIHAPHKAIEIEGAIGSGSLFDATHGYHADGIEQGLPPLPDDWHRRLIPVRNANTNGATGWCLEVHDLAAAKYAAHREKDLRYTSDLWEAGMLDPDYARAPDPIDPDRAPREARDRRSEHPPSTTRPRKRAEETPFGLTPIHRRYRAHTLDRLQEKSIT